MRKFTVDELAVEVYDDRGALGAAAARAIAHSLNAAVESQGEARALFASAPSQNEMLSALRQSGVDWARVTLFHMDEYIGLPAGAPQGFAQYLKDHLLQGIVPKGANFMEFDLAALDEGLARYAALYNEKPMDVACLGVGENGHLAFNDPAIADFNDPLTIKRVFLDLQSRQQQVNDGCFARLEDVPTDAVTLTMPALLSGEALFCIVPGATKRQAVRQMLTGPVSEACPASILRTCPNCTLYLDADSFGDLAL